MATTQPGPGRQRLVDLAPRILYLAGHFMAPPYTAGSSRPLALARRFVADGHDVTLLSTDAFLRQAGLRLDDVPAEHLGGVDVVLTRSGYANDMGDTRRKVEFASQATRQALLALRGDVDLVYATSTPLTVLGPALARRLLRHTPFAFEVRDVWPQAAIDMGALDSPWQQRLGHWLADTGYARAIRVVTLSEGMRDMVAARGVDPARITVAHNAADPTVPASDNGDAPSDPRARAVVEFLAGAGVAAVCTGTIGRANDVAWLVDLHTRLAARDPDLDLRLAIVGSGSEAGAVRAAIEAAPDGTRRRIAMFDPMPKGALLATMAHADLAFSTFADQPSLATNSPNKVFDAWACGVPVAINNGGWLADELDRHGAGLALPRDPAAAATTLATWLATPGALAAAARAARARVADEYNWDNEYRRIRDALAAALSQEPT